MEEQLELVVSAYLDGEPVEAASVLAALDTEEGRQVLVDFVRLRLVVRDDESPRPEFYGRMRGVMPTLPARSGRRPRGNIAWPIAAALAASLAIGFWTGSAFTTQNVARSSRGQSVGPLKPDAPPKAVRVIEFQPGVDWHQSPSGQEIMR
jgi:hypothetical protein